jgi:hypothetical protein
MSDQYARLRRFRFRWMLRAVAAALTLAAPAMAQVDSIRARADAVALRPIWSRYGNQTGNVVADLWDINEDGRSEFAVEDYRGDWRIFSLDSLGDASVIWQRPGLSAKPLVHGDIRGAGRHTLVYPRSQNSPTLGTLYWLDFFDADSGRVADTPSMTRQAQAQGCLLRVERVLARDLDLDGADELIVSAAGSWCGDVISVTGEIWIYRGGPGFQVDTPTVIIRDQSDNGNFYDLHIGKLDDDEYPDLFCVTRNGARIRWGGADLLALDRRVDRIVFTPAPFARLLDADGDDRADVLTDGGFPYVHLHLSSNRVDARQRAFDATDADRTFVGSGDATFVIGPLNDSANRYEMFGVSSGRTDGIDYDFSGGATGPDSAYDAWNSGRMKRYVALGDVDGNGWRDLLCGNSDGDGAAVVFGGGPYIPRDSMPLSAIFDIAVDGRRAAISVWPNPATDVVNIAWRGDLGRTPERFVVHDALGRLVAAGDADHHRGEVIWRCGGRAAGTYLLTIFDRRGALIATCSILKH